MCDIGILITKDLGKKKHYSGEYPGSIPLPAALYKVVEALEGEEAPQPKVRAHVISLYCLEQLAFVTVFLKEVANDLLSAISCL